MSELETTLKKILSTQLKKCLEANISISDCVDDILPLTDDLIVLVLQDEGKSKHQPDTKYNALQLAKGILVELEHIDSVEAAKEIAKDHLEEIPDYYDKLEKMEAKS